MHALQYSASDTCHIGLSVSANMPCDCFQCNMKQRMMGYVLTFCHAGGSDNGGGMC